MGYLLSLDSQLREACPAHKQNDLEALVKSLKGDEAKIREKISEWWDEPVVATEGDWEDVNKKSSQGQKATVPAKVYKQQGRGRGAADTGGRGRSARGTGRGGGREGRGRGRVGEQGPNNELKHDTEENEGAKLAATPPATPAGIPTTANVRAPQGAWAKKSADPEPSPPLPVSEPVAPPSPAPVAEPIPLEFAPPPAPSPPVPTLTPAPTKLPAPTGNVWATKGSAHLIQAEKPRPPPTSTAPSPIAPAPISRKSNGTRKSNRNAPTVDDTVVPITPPEDRTPNPPVPVAVPSPVAPPAPTVLAAPTISAPPVNAWNQEKSDSVPRTVSPAPPLTQPIRSVPEQKSPPKSEVPTTNVLNMGRWETGDADDNLDFGFGSFGNDNATSDGGAKPESTSAAPPAAAASPARPPPGLSAITGMPPMPANAVLVHELENKLEQVSVSKQQQHPQVPDNQAIVAGRPSASHHQQPQPHAPPPHMTAAHDSHIPSQPSYGSNNNQYGSATAAGMGMYSSYNAGGAAVPAHAFVGMPGSGGLGGGAAPQPQQQQQYQPQPPKGPPPPQQQQQQPGLYISAPSSGNVPVVGAATNDNVGLNNNNAATGMPPGMQGMPYGNPMYYGQQQFHMGQHHQPNIGYNYGYGGQFAGGVQGGFGYPGAMPAGYGHGGPSYDDPTGEGGAGAGLPGSAGVGVGGYNPQQPQPPKNSGGYRGGGGGGRHTNNQYQQQQQYNPQQQQQHHQHGGYGAQPYGMGYHGDHFNQRGGYGNMQDPYAMQQQQQQQQQQGVSGYVGGGFQGDNQYKGKKGSRGGLNQFQPQGPPNQHLSGQQPFGLQGQGGSDLNQQSADGWANQGGGWSGGASGWQGNK